MSGGLLVTLPLQLACQLIGGGNSTLDSISVVLNETTTLPEGYTAFEDVGVAYKYYANKMTWNAARKQCIAVGGDLAVIDSFDKVGYAASLKEKSINAHVGLHRLFNNIEWMSVKSGEPVAFVPWKPEANMNSGAGGCTVLWFDGSGLSPSNCSQELPSICEISLFKGHKRKLEVLRREENVESLRQTEITVNTKRVTSLG
ncbi:uncharacterized protein LOC124186145 isoform X1 [Neodiprion fabricii]|uniref:uncharacterized protein LOC124186145 isoform X1 n=1 Tax=Neodiprion fabricii TaxID=2872261 RepID=UPI001ED91F54|nr:uncharacterized protein LOC124186145 isoform X1 [Neodiprion fabricii]